jgi:hypothetical protein
MDTTTARGFAAKVAWHGHQSGRGVAPDVIAEAIALGLIREVPRLGGYTATKAANAAEFGDKFADWAAR